MSEATKGSNDSLPAANATEKPIEQGNQQVDETDVTQSGGESSPDRLLSESKKWKARAIAAEKAIKEAQTKAQEEQGKYKELFEQRDKQYKELNTKIIKERINSSVKAVAAKSGCVDPDAVLALGDFSLLQIDEDTGEVFGTDTFVETVKKTKPYLFQSNRPPTINGASPTGVAAPKKLTASDILKLPKTEQDKYWAAAFRNKEAKTKR